jgi:hypothetical protein
VNDYNSISYEARERARSRERDGELERIARRARAEGRKQPSILRGALKHLRRAQRRRLAGQI